MVVPKAELTAHVLDTSTPSGLMILIHVILLWGVILSAAGTYEILIEEELLLFILSAWSAVMVNEEYLSEGSKPTPLDSGGIGGDPCPRLFKLHVNINTLLMKISNFAPLQWCPP